MVRAYEEVVGRGPTKTRVLFAGADTLIVVLENTMTIQERNLAALAEEARVREHRLFLTRIAEVGSDLSLSACSGDGPWPSPVASTPAATLRVEILTLEPRPTDGPVARTYGATASGDGPQWIARG